MNTSADMGGQGDKLAEPFLLEVVAQGIGLGCTDVDVSDDQGVLFGVDHLLQMLGQLGEGLIFGPVDGNDVQRLHADLYQLKIGLLKFAEA